MRKLLIFAVLVLTVVSTSHAALVPVDFASEFSGYTLDLTYGVITDEFAGDIAGIDVISAAYSNGSSYVYLYQVDNSSVAKLGSLAIRPFAGLTSETNMGYISGGDADLLIAGFLAGTSIPDFGIVDENYGPTGTFHFIFSGITTGTTSSIMYIESGYGSGESNGYVQNGGQNSGTVIAAIPEPTTICLLGLGALGLLRRKR